MKFLPLLCGIYLFTISPFLQADSPANPLSVQLTQLQQQLHAEQQHTEQWLKALQRSSERNQKRLAQATTQTKPALLTLQQALHSKRQLLARYRLKLADTQQNIPVWIALSEANQVNQQMQQQIKEAELLLQSSQQLNTQSWLMRTPEELWQALEQAK